MSARRIGVRCFAFTLLAALVVGVPGCSTPERKQAGAAREESLGPPVSAGQTFETAHFTVRTLPEPGWALIGTHDSLLAIGKMNWKTRESEAATVWATTLREPPTEAVFGELVDELRRADSMPPRHKLLRMSEPAQVAEGGMGLAYEMEVVDQTVPAVGGKPMILEIYAQVRRHPARRDVVVTAKYSYRHVDGTRDPESAARAKAFLEGITIPR